MRFRKSDKPPRLVNPGLKNMQSDKKQNQARHVEIAPDALPLHCPTPEMSLWNAHPRVYLPIEATGEALCPYCGTRYTLIGKPSPSRH